ncbi:MAG: hypothetical protein ABJA94_03370 [Rhodoglobus sp.]
MAASPLFVTADSELADRTEGELVVAPDAVVALAGRHTGRVEVQGGATARITGVVEGTVTIESLATAIIVGDLMGDVEIRVAATLVIESEGRLAGRVTNFGSFTNFGYRSCVTEERLPDDRPGSIVEPPNWHGAGPRLADRR